jgi:hypothetical protein
MAKPLTFQDFPYAGETPPARLAWLDYYEALPVTAGRTLPDGSAEAVTAAPPPSDIFEAGFAAGVEWVRKRALRKDDPDAK